MKRRSMALVALTIIVSMLTAGFCVSAVDFDVSALDTSRTYIFTENFNYAKTPLAETGDTATPYTQFVTAKVPEASIAKVKVENGAVSGTTNTNEYALSVKNPIPAPAADVIGEAAYVVDIEMQHERIGSGGAVYIGLRAKDQFVAPEALGSLTADVIWLAVSSTNIGVGKPITNTTNGKKWSMGTPFKYLTKFRVYDNVADGVITFYTVDGATETEFAEITIGSYNEEDDITPLTYTVGANDPYTLNVSGKVASNAWVYPQLYSYNMNGTDETSNISAFSVTASAMAENALTSLRVNGEEVDLDTYEHNIQPQTGNRITINAVAPYGTDYKIYIADETADGGYSEIIAKDGENEIDVSNTEQVKLAVNYSDGSSADYLFNLGSKPGNVTIAPEAGSYEEETEVTITGSGQEGAEIYYTKDGSDPSDEANENRIVYEEAITLSLGETATIKAVEKLGDLYGAVAESTFDLTINVTAVSFSLTEERYIETKSLTLSSTDADAVIYYTLDGSDPADEENENRREYTAAIELEATPETITEYTVKAVACRFDSFYGAVTEKTYRIGFVTVSYRIDETKISSGTDPAWSSLNSAETATSFTTSTADPGYFRVSKGSDGTNQWAVAVLKSRLSDTDGGYTMELYVKDLAAHATDTQRAFHVYLREASNSVISTGPIINNNAPILMFQKSKIGLRTGSWGASAATYIDFPEMDLSSESKIKITDNFETGKTFVYVDDKLVAYGVASGKVFTLYSALTEQSVSYTYASNIPTSNVYPKIAISHNPVQLKDVKVTVKAPETPETIIALKAEGTYEGSVSVPLKQFVSGRRIYYTLDGTTPTEHSTVYNREILLDEVNVTKTIKAYATDGINSSEIYEFTYTVVPYQPGNVTFSLPGGEYSTQQSVALTGSGKLGAEIYYTTDGSDPTDENNLNRMFYFDTITVPNNAETTITAVEKIGEVYGVVSRATYYTGTVKSPPIAYPGDANSLVIGEDEYWITPDSRNVNTAFIMADDGDWMELKRGGDGSPQHSNARFYRMVSATDRGYSIEFDVRNLASGQGHASVFISPRATTAEEVTGYTTLKFAFQGNGIGIRTGTWGSATCSTFVTIPSMNLTAETHIKFVDDLVNNVFSFYADGELVAVAVKNSNGSVTLTSLQTGDSISWSEGTVPSSGYPKLYNAHNSSQIKNLTLYCPYEDEIKVDFSHKSNAYVGAQRVVITNYYGTPVYYTLDGSDPADETNENRALYEEAITFNPGTTILKAVAYNPNTGTYRGANEKVYRIYESDESVTNDINKIADEEMTDLELHTTIANILAVTDITITNDSYYKALENTEKWDLAVREILKEAKETTGTNLTLDDFKLSAYRAAVVAYFMDTIEGGAVTAVANKANDTKQQYKMKLPINDLGFANLPESVQSWVLGKIKAEAVPDTEGLNMLIYEKMALSAVEPLCNVSGYTSSEKSTILLKVLNETNLLTGTDTTFTGWGQGSEKQLKVVSNILDKAENITTIEALKALALEEISSVAGEGDTGGGVREPGGYGGSGSGGATITGGIIVPQPVKPAEKFSDAKSEAPWAYEAIIALSNSGIVAGYPDGTFAANNSVTREEYVKMLIVALNIHNENAVCSFTDASEGEWYNSYIASAVEKGIVKGISETEFGVGSLITREDMAVIAYRAVMILGKNLPNSSEATQFTDGENIAEYAADAVAQMQKANIINGMGDGTFAPKNQATRAQAAYIIYSIISAVNA